MESLFEGILELTKEIILDLYSKKTKYVFSYFDEDIIWIDPLEENFIFGKKEVEKVIYERTPISFQIIDSNFQLILKDRYSCVVAGLIEICIDESVDYFFRCKQRVTVVYKIKNQKLLLTHMHISEIVRSLEGNKIFPIKLTKPVYQYIQQFIYTQFYKEKENKLVIYDTKRHIHFISEKEIIYIEADNIHSHLYCKEERITILESISKFQKRLSSKFVRIHRSFLININYIVEIERFTVHMSNGIKLPIPEKKYTEVKKEIYNKIGDNFKK